MPTSYPDESATPIILPGCTKTAFRSLINNREYEVSVALPYEAPGPDGYGVLYVLDGYAYFASAAEATRANLNAPGVVVVGIGYPETATFIEPAIAKRADRDMAALGVPDYIAACAFERFKDLALPADAETLARESIPGMFELRPEDVGGLDDFLEIIETEIKPRIAAMVPVDHANQALFGHSLGGLAVLRALFTNHARFGTFIAASPAIWWANQSVLDGEAAFAAQVADRSAQPRLLVTVGSDEETAPGLPKSMKIDPDEFRASIEGHRMIRNARALVERLQALRGKGSYYVEDCVVFPRQQHGIVPWPSLGRGISFAFAERSQGGGEQDV